MIKKRQKCHNKEIIKEGYTEKMKSVINAYGGFRK